jgi:hypothetical protein
METMIGFAIGYYFGTRHGREGLAQARGALEAIVRSDETRQLAATAFAAAQPVFKQLVSSGPGAILSGVIEQLARQRGVVEQLRPRAA